MAQHTMTTGIGTFMKSSEAAPVRGGRAGSLAQVAFRRRNSLARSGKPPYHSARSDDWRASRICPGERVVACRFDGGDRVPGGCTMDHVDHEGRAEPIGATAG